MLHHSCSPNAGLTSTRANVCHSSLREGRNTIRTCVLSVKWLGGRRRQKIAIASLMNLEVTQFARNGALYRTEPRSRNFVCVCVFMYRDFHHVNWRFKCKCAAIVLRMTIRIVFFLEAIFCVCGEFYVSIHGERAVTSVSIL